MHTSSLITSLALLSTTGWAQQYALEDDYFSGNFFDHFSFFTGDDPTHGNVPYQDRGAASNAGLISTSSSNARMSVDTSNTTPNGRPSVRITSNKSYNSGTLVILDLEHMPVGCGTWPAFWTVGPNWPNSGEIDIIEGVHEQTSNDMTLHTGAGCSITNNGQFSGSITYSDCESSGSNNNGCQITTSNTQTYGDGFNNGDGGVYAMQWTDSAISVFFFPRSSIPSDITSGSPSPSGWGKPLAMFQGGCDIPSHFQNQQIVFDITFCGDWAGNTWSSSSCASKAGSCSDYVANNPSAFQDAYWSVNSLKVYSTSSSWSASIISNSSTEESAASAAAPVSSTVSLAESTTAVPATTSAAVLSINPTSSSAPAQSTHTHHAWAPHWDGDGAVEEDAINKARSVNIDERDAVEIEAEPAAAGQFAAYRGGPGKFAPELIAERRARHLRQHKRHGAGRL